jgi:hypothetical protein
MLSIRSANPNERFLRKAALPTRHLSRTFTSTFRFLVTCTSKCRPCRMEARCACVSLQSLHRLVRSELPPPKSGLVTQVSGKRPTRHLDLLPSNVPSTVQAPTSCQLCYVRLRTPPSCSNTPCAESRRSIRSSAAASTPTAVANSSDDCGVSSSAPATPKSATACKHRATTYPKLRLCREKIACGVN